jgi:hypothetical protein
VWTGSSGLSQSLPWRVGQLKAQLQWWSTLNQPHASWRRPPAAAAAAGAQGSAETGESSYASLVGRVLGPAGEGLLQAALFGFCFGVMAVYLVVCGDVLAGEGLGGGGGVTRVSGGRG